MRIVRQIFTLLFTYLLIGSGLSLAQLSKEKGFPLITNYSFKEYGADGQNWAILQGDQGKMYFGNNRGLLEFDGISWRLYQVPNQSVIRSLTHGDSSKIYAGGVGDLGFFQADKAGKLVYHSLLNLIPRENRDFADVWEADKVNDKVYFNTAKYVLIWDIQKKDFTVITSEKGFHRQFKVNDKIYWREWGKGIGKVQGDSIVLLKGGEAFAEERTYVMLPFPDNDTNSLLVTRNKGLFKYDGQQFTPFPTEADQFVKENLIYLPGTLLQDGNFLLGTLSGGGVVIDLQGKVQQYFNVDKGIIDNTIYSSYQDLSGNIWLANGNGISNINYASAASYFDARNKLSTSTYDLVRYKGKVYVAANSGLYYLDTQTSSFIPVKNSNPNQYFTFLKAGNTLLVGGGEGLYEIEKEELKPIRRTVGNEYVSQVLKPSLWNPDRVYVGALGLWSVRKNGNTWIDEGNIFPSSDGTNGIEEMEDGSVWVSTTALGVYHANFEKTATGDINLSNPVIEHFGSESGLQKGLTFITKINSKLYFTSPDSIYRFDEGKKRFYSDPADPIVEAYYRLANKQTVIVFQKDSLDRLWLSTTSTLAMGTPQADGSYHWETKAFKRFAAENITRVFSEQDGLTWFLGLSSLINYDFSKSTASKNTFDAMVRGVTIDGDSTIYFGGLARQLESPQFDFRHNSIQFTYAATSFEEKGKLLFQTFLGGFDENWSGWTTEALKEYTNLAPGSYTFQVKAVNTLGEESSIATYSFEILPPWYRTWWAYAIFALSFGLLAYGFVKMQQHRAVVRERQKSAIREANLKANAENERRKNIELISEMGRDITASLSIEHIIETVYAHVNKLMDASVFGIGIYNKDNHLLEFPGTKEKGETLRVYSYRLDDSSRPASWCYNNKKKIFINDYEKEYGDYVTEIGEVTEGEHSESIIYLPLIYKDKVIGVITAQSFSKNAYNEYHLNVLRSLATYTAVALDNADAYRHLQATQGQLIQAEKMASLGELTAGIAHEIQNPLNFVTNFSEINSELIDELVSEISKEQGQRDEKTEVDLMEDIKENHLKITRHAKRADAIVKGMLQHSKRNNGEKVLTNINALANEYLRLSYHGP
jgi:GAF domain-containing protein